MIDGLYYMYITLCILYGYYGYVYGYLNLFLFGVVVVVVLEAWL